jgi:hypothetical protein
VFLGKILLMATVLSLPQAVESPSPQQAGIAIEKPVPADQLTFLKSLEGKTADAALKDKQLSKLIGALVPGCTFHYGHDMTLEDALDLALKGSMEPVRIREGRYFFMHGAMGPGGGRGFFWIDMQTGLGVGGFAFHPSNGEPTPALILFSRQIKEPSISMSDLPQALDSDLMAWQHAYGVPPVTARYFIDGTNKRLLLEHDEDFCALPDGSTPAPGCDEQNADAADLDVVVAYYVDHIHFSPSGTAWKLNEDQMTWIAQHSSRCKAAANPNACRLRSSREQVRLILHIAGPRAARRR